MYCSSCGTAAMQGLRFCKNCGARLEGKEREENQPSESFFYFLIIALLGIPIAGIGLIIGLITVMKKELGFDNQIVGIVTIFSFLLLLMAETGFFALLLARVGRGRKKDNADKQLGKQLNEAATRSLGEAQPHSFVNPVNSVTENTTRTLEMAERER